MRLDILVVDDIHASRAALCSLVQALGHQAIGADSGLAALDQVRRRRPDLVLLDLLMPDLDGFEVTRRLRDLCGDLWLPVIVTSSLHGDEHFIHALQNGADDYLSRPVNAALLEAKLRHYSRVLALQGRISGMAQRQRDIQDNILDAVVTLAADGRVEEMNRAAQALFDRPATAPGTGSATMQSVGAAAASGRDMACQAVLGVALADLLTQRECRLRRPDGSSFSAEVSLSEWREDGGVRYTLVLRDLTERQQIDRMKDEFLATVSHELRTPLTSVLGALGLLAGGAAGALPPAAVPLAEVARRNGERLSRLIDDILDLTKLEGDRLVLHLRPQTAAPLLREALAANQGYAGRAGVRLVAEGLDGAARTGTTLRLDADRFLQVMANLLSNAIKHSPAGEVVRVTLSETPAAVRISVRDRGPGIQADFRSQMFEKFSQADGGDRRAQGGTGLGLYIARMLVERMGGRISADAVAEGGGASFSVSFPAAPLPAPALAWVLHIDADFSLRDRVARWLGPDTRLLSAAEPADAAAQAALLPAGARLALVIGNPQAQGSADAFCATLKRLAAGAPVLLYGDSVDAAFAARLGQRWLSPTGTGPEDLRQVLRDALAIRAGGESAP